MPAQELKYSALHKKVVEFLQGEGLSVQVEYELGPYHYDICIEGTDRLIEVNGDYWHANPVIYKPMQLIRVSPNKYEPAWLIQNRDMKKTLFAEKNSFHVMTVWESEIRMNWVKTSFNILNFIKFPIIKL